MTRIYHYDTTYEKEAADGTVTASVELRIYYTVAWGREATRDEPGYGDTVEFHSVAQEICSTRKYEDISNHTDDPLIDWAEAFVEDHQAELIENAADIDQGEREAAADYRGERS